jgi:hypothetical protein
MQYATPGLTWDEWVDANDDRDDATKLAALREYITATAREWVRSGDITGAWANKKLAKLGIADRLGTNTYVLEAPITGAVRLTLAAATRAEAAAEFQRVMGHATGASILSPQVTADPTVISGPEDPDPNVVDPDVPATVQATLEMLREIILLGNVSGPRFNCDSGANRVLAEYGLAPVPPRKEYVVTRPATATMRTVVQAYDEASAERIAEWRWEDGRSGYTISDATPGGPFAVDEN